MPRVQKVTPKALRNPLFGALRSMPGVPKASLESTLSKPPFKPPLSDLASESDTCPEYPYIGPSRKLPSAPRVQRVILPPEASEHDTCLEDPLAGSFPGRSPECATCAELGNHPGAAQKCSEGIPGRPPGTRRIRHVSPGVFLFPPNFRKYTENS